MRYKIKKRISIHTFSKKGFTVLETLVAISILLVSVVGPISLIGDALHKLYFARDEMIAINLAQEGIEAVRQVKNSNTLAGNLWSNNIGPGSYIVNPLLTPPVAPLGGDSGIYIDSTTGLYEQGTVTVNTTQFSRIVTISNVSLGREMNVTSNVTWTTGGHSGAITASENIFNW